MKKEIKFILSTFIVGFLIGILASGVVAATVKSNVKKFGPINGYSYENFAELTDYPTLSSTTSMGNQSSGKVPTGYMGVKAMVYKSGVLCGSSNTVYNPSETRGYAVTLVWLRDRLMKIILSLMTGK